ncbi:MAG: mechanosensitive ion channel [Flavobacteriales bacterium]|nr:mechanosensitive ion channel [Flavobacteriales bacterium]
MKNFFKIFTTPVFKDAEYFQFSIVDIFFAILIFFFARFLIKFVRQFIRKVLKKKEWFDEDRSDTIYRFFRLLLIVLSTLAIFSTLKFKKLLDVFLNYSIIDLDHFHPKVYNLFIIILIVLFARIIIRFILLLLKKALDSRKQIDRGQQFTILQLVKYLLYIIAFIIAIESTGADLKGLLIGSAAILVGVGIGLQTFFYDVLSGFIILFEGTFKVGDIIEIDKLFAKVIRIDIRTSKVLTRDGNVIVVPNRKLTSESLVNWTINNDISRYQVTAHVAYGSNIAKVRQILYDCALKHADIEKTKEILVRFDDFGSSSLEFNLFFWTKRSWDIDILKSDIRFAIEDAFRKEGIKIPFPQREIHINQKGSSSFEGRLPSV